jgi:hypothetical protein
LGAVCLLWVELKSNKIEHHSESGAHKVVKKIPVVLRVMSETKSLLKDESSWDNSHPFVDEEHFDEMIEQS